MKILFVSPVGALFSGAEVAIVNLMKFLSQQGYEIYNVIPDNEYPDQNYLDIMEQSGIQLYSLKTIHWWWQESSQNNQVNPDAIKAYHHQHIGDIREIIQREKIDLVISNTINVFQGAFAAACENIPHFYIIHEFPYGEFGYYKEKIDLINQLSDKIFAVEGGLYHTLSEYFPAEKLLPFAPYSDVMLRELEPSENLRVVSIGGISERKNQLELIKAYHLLDRSDIELVFIGAWDEKYKKQCDQYIEEHQLANITFLGYQTDPWTDVTSQDMIVLPSKLETFSLVFVEAVLNGVPTIVSDNPGHLSSAKHFDVHHFYSLGNIQQLADEIATVLEHFEDVKSKAEAKKMEARQLYTLEKTSKIFLDQIENAAFKEEATKLKGMHSLIGWQLDDDILKFIKGNQIEISFSDDGQQYSLDKNLTHPLKSSDCFIIPVKTAGYLKINLSEFPGAYSQLSLQSKSSGQTIPIHSLNGFIKNPDDTIMFVEKYPQLVYKLQSLNEDEFLFSYKKIPIDDYVGNLKNLHASLQNAEANYAELLYQHNCVVTSRRWKWTTQLVNLFKKRK